MLTLGQAAKEAGVAKSAISRAIKTGRLSAKKTENGSFEIDPVELFRVYPSNGSVNTESERLATHEEHPQQHREIAILRELIDEIKGERDNLRTERERLLKVIEGQSETVKQLTYQPDESEPLRPKMLFLGASVKLWVSLAITACLAVIWFLWERNQL